MFPCEFCEISKNIFFTEHLLTTASTFLYPKRISDVSEGIEIERWAKIG